MIPTVLRDAPRLVTVAQFADYVGQHVQTVYKRVRLGTQPGVRRFGRDVRIDIDVALKGAESD